MQEKLEERKEEQPSQAVSVDQRISQYLLFQDFLKRNAPLATDMQLLKVMMRKHASILQLCNSLRNKVLKRLLANSH